MELGLNDFNLYLGLGAGVLINLIVRAVVDARREKREALEEKEKDHYHWHDRANSELEGLKHKMKLVIDRIDQHAGRIEKLESKRK